MKKLIVCLIAALMVVSMIPAVTLTASAAGEGEWTTVRRTGENEWDEGFDPEADVDPAPGYEYTDDGFTTISPDWSNMPPFFTVQTKEAKPLKEGFYMQVRVDEYSYGGEDCQADHWISFSLNDRRGMSQASTAAGNNWFCLLRRQSRPLGQSNVESWYAQGESVRADGGKKPGVAAQQISLPVDVPVEDGCEIYTLEVTWDGANYDIKVNGLSVVNQKISDNLKTWVESGEYYVGVTFHTGVTNGKAACTILKSGTSEATATTPVGTDSKEPDRNTTVFGDIIDPTTVPANQPALMWDASTFDFGNNSTAIIEPQGDNSFRVSATTTPVNTIFSPEKETSYKQSDFPVFSMVLRNFWNEGGSIYFLSGEQVTAGDNYLTEWGLYDEGCGFLGEDGEYVLIVCDIVGRELLTEKLDGRIHGVQVMTAVSSLEDEALSQWDICYAGFFRSVEEAQAYATDRTGLELVTEGSGEVPTDEPDTDEATTPENDDTTPENDDTTPENETTVAPETDEQTEASEPGCKSAVGFGAVAILTAAAAAVALKKKD